MTALELVREVVSGRITDALQAPDDCVLGGFVGQEVALGGGRITTYTVEAVADGGRDSGVDTGGSEWHRLGQDPVSER